MRNLGRKLPVLIHERRGVDDKVKSSLFSDMDSQGRKVVVCDNGTGVSCYLMVSLNITIFAKAGNITFKIV